LNAWHLKRALRVLQAGGVIAYPTEAVFGLGCRPDSATAVARVLRMKGRAADKGVILVASDVEQVRPLVESTRVPWDTVLPTWPGPVTWILPAAPGVLPSWITGGRAGVAVRVSAHPVVRALCGAAGPLVSTSANPSNRPPARNVLQVLGYFRGRVDLVVPGRLGGACRPSEIRDAISGRILRKGG
jgi:L-threonylcarbamoyladenylate synthase